MRQIKISYIGGGSRNWARTLIKDLAMEDSFSAEVYLYDLDYKAAKDNEIIANSVFARNDTIGKHKFIAVDKLNKALVNSDFVVISILPATFKEMQSDVHLPEKYGIYQSVGDTVGPGGILRAMRTVPIYKEFALAIKENCPNAWVINYTNPMSMCVKTLYDVFPEIKAFGCCHEVFGTQALLARAFYEDTGIRIGKKDVKINVLGINHFTWINKAKYENYDLLKSYDKMVQKYYYTGYQESKDYHWESNTMVGFHRVKFDLYKRYGMVAAAGDRHLAEFCPGAWYLESPEKVHEWKFNLTPVSNRIKEAKEKILITDKLVSGEEKLDIKPSGEEGVKLIKALCGLGDFVSNCNLPNYGQVDGLPQGAIVETNAVFAADSVKPVISGGFNAGVLNLVQKVSTEQTETVKAILAEDYESVFNCFANDALVRISLADARKLFVEMLENTKEYIPNAQKFIALNKN